MPYLKPEDKAWLAKHGPMRKAGDLCYKLVLVCLEYADQQTKLVPTFQLFNDIAGALWHSMMEIWWRMTRPYEDKKIKENGDVFPPPFGTKEKE